MKKHDTTGREQNVLYIDDAALAAPAGAMTPA
jgi:hypothetical protein